MTKKSPPKVQSPLVTLLTIVIGTSIGVALSMSGLPVVPLVVVATIVTLALVFYGYWQVRRAEKAVQNNGLKEADSKTPKTYDENGESSDSS